MYKLGTAIIAVLAAILCWSLAPSSAFQTVEGETESLVKWYSLEEASELVKSAPKKVFVDVYTDWCGWCKRMDKDTFQHPQIAEYMNENFYPVKLDGEHKGPIVINGTTFSYVAGGLRGYHEAAAMLLKGKMSYPTVAFLDEKMKAVIVAPGYQTPQDLDTMMRYVAEGHQEAGTPYNLFSSTFRSRIKVDVAK